MPRTRSSKTRTSAKRSIAARSTPTASRGSRVLVAPAAPTRVPASAVTVISKVSVLVRKVSPVLPGAGAAAPTPVVAAAGSAVASRIFCGQLLGGGRGARANFEPEDFGVGADVQAEMSVSLTDAASGATQRLHLPNGKDVDV